MLFRSIVPRKIYIISDSHYSIEIQLTLCPHRKYTCTCNYACTGACSFVWLSFVAVIATNRLKWLLVEGNVNERCTRLDSGQIGDWIGSQRCGLRVAFSLPPSRYATRRNASLPGTSFFHVTFHFTLRRISHLPIIYRSCEPPPTIVRRNYDVPRAVVENFHW